MEIKMSLAHILIPAAAQHIEDYNVQSSSKFIMGSDRGPNPNPQKHLTHDVMFNGLVYKTLLEKKRRQRV